MKSYIGVKQIKATAMNRLDYNKYRGWDLPSDEDGSDEGMLVEYVDGGKANHKDHAGYISWSPLDVFKNAYKETSGVTFGLAVEALKLGKRVQRSGWNGKGMFVFQQVPAQIGRDIVPKMQSLPQSVKDEFERRFNDPDEQIDAIYYNDQLALVGLSNVISGWAPSTNDSLAEDWIILD
jgi:hypothetical protein